MKVTNEGDGVVEDIVLTSNVPANVNVDSIANNGRRVGNQVIWSNLGTLKPNQTVTTSNTITFNPLAKLSPKQVASWELRIKAAKVGDVRFRIKLESDQMKRSVDETEATTFYR